MNYKVVISSSFAVLMILATSAIVCVSPEAEAEPSASDWMSDSRYFDFGLLSWDLTEKAVHVSDLNAKIPFVEGFSNIVASALIDGPYDGWYGRYGSVTLSGDETFEKIAPLFEKKYGLVCILANLGDELYYIVFVYDAPEPVINYDVTGTLVSGAISATAVKTADATADLENPLFYVIAHYNDGKFISMYVPATVAGEGTLSLSNMGVSTLGLVDVMVGVVGEIPSDALTVYYGEKILTATA